MHLHVQTCVGVCVLCVFASARLYVCMDLCLGMCLRVCAYMRVSGFVSCALFLTKRAGFVAAHYWKSGEIDRVLSFKPIVVDSAR
jgi:hypothetical protein